MPIYEYRCTSCGTRFDRLERMSASGSATCPGCGAQAERLVSRVAAVGRDCAPGAFT